MALFNVAQMVAQARPQMMGGQRMQVPQVWKSEDKREEGYSKIGERVGKGFGSMWDPDEMMQRALQTQKLIAAMPKELRQNTLANPDVQARLKHYYRFAPELFADAELTTGNPKMKGMLDFIDEEYSERQKQETQREMDKAKLETQKEQPGAVRAQTQENKASAALKEQQFDWNARIEDIEYLIKSGEPAMAMAKLQSLKAETAARKQSTEESKQLLQPRIDSMNAQTQLHRAEAGMSPQRADLMEAQAAHLREETSLMAAKLKAAVDKASNKMTDEEKELLKIRGRTFDQHQQNISKSRMPPRAYDFVQEVNDTNAMVQALESAPVTHNGQTVYLPKAITNAGSMFYVNKSLDDIFSHVAQTGKKIAPQDLDAMFVSADRLYKNTYEYLDNEAIKKVLPQDVFRLIHDPQMRAKMLYVQLVNEKVNGTKLQNGQRTPMTPQREEQLKQLIEQSGGVPSVVDMAVKPSFFDNMVQMFTPSDVGVE